MDRDLAAALLASICLFGCQAAPGPEAPLDLGPCAAVWGPEPAEGRLYVDPGADAGGDGSYGSPLDSLYAPGGNPDSALELARVSGTRAIALAAGTYPVALRLSEAETGDGGLELTGCGASLTELVGMADDDGVLQPVVDVTGPETADVLLRDLSLSGGRRNLVIRDGAGLAGPIVVQRVDVLEALRVGMLIDGDATVAALLDVRIDGVLPEDGALGWGLAIQTGAGVGDPVAAPTVLDTVEVTGASEVGVLVDGGWIDAIDLEVTGIAALDGALGRGVQLQNHSRASLQGVVASGNADAAVYLHKPGRSGEAVVLSDSTLSGTLPGALPDSSPTGDGLVISIDGAQQPPDEFLAIVDSVSFSGNPRSHVLVEGATLQMGGNSVFGMDTTLPLAAQGGAVVEGLGGGPPPVEPEQVAPGAELGILSAPLVPDEPGS